MSKAAIISINPKWCELIAQGKKTIEVRKTKPKLEIPFKVYIYCTKPSKKHQTVFGGKVLVLHTKVIRMYLELQAHRKVGLC